MSTTRTAPARQATTTPLTSQLRTPRDYERNVSVEGGDQAVDGVLGGHRGDLDARRQRAAAAVTGPMHTTTGGTPGEAGGGHVTRSTVDPDVNVMASAARARSTSSGDAGTGTVR